MSTTTGIVVKVARLPGTVTEFALESGATVATALSQAGYDTSGYQVQVNGESADTSRTLADGDTVILTRQIKGNQGIIVRVAKLPGAVQQVALEEGATVADALSTANVDASGFQVQVNGESASTGETLEDGDTVLLTRQIKGN